MLQPHTNYVPRNDDWRFGHDPNCIPKIRQIRVEFVYYRANFIPTRLNQSRDGKISTADEMCGQLWSFQMVWSWEESFWIPVEFLVRNLGLIRMFASKHVSSAREGESSLDLRVKKQQNLSALSLEDDWSLIEELLSKHQSWIATGCGLNVRRYFCAGWLASLFRN